MTRIPSATLRPTRPRQKRHRGTYTYTDFLALLPDDQKADLIDGVIYTDPPNLTHHASLEAFLATLLHALCERYQLGEIFLCRVAYRLDDWNAVEPDIGFIPRGMQKSILSDYVAGPPALAIEVVDRVSAHRDYVLKRSLYEKAGVREYWIIDPDAKTATFLYSKGKRFSEGKPVKHLWHSKVLPGLTLDVRWLWLDEFPSAFDLLRDHYYPEPR